MRKPRPFLVLLAVLGTGIVIGCLFRGAAHAAQVQHDFSALINKLNDGTITEGSSMRATIPLAKARAEVSRGQLGAGDRFILAVFSHESELLQLYSRNDKLFAAQFIDLRLSQERWSFCDKDLFGQHVSLGLAPASRIP